MKPPAKNQSMEATTPMRCHPLRRIKFALAERIKAMVAASPDTLAGKRDRALVLLGFAGAFRRSELVALRVADVDESQAGLRVIVRHSKTDQEGEGATVAIARGAVVCPVKALQEWLEAAGISSGPVFRAVSKSGAVAEAGLSDRSVANIVKAMVGAVGLDATAFSGHSLRSGFLTSAATAARTFSR